MATKQARKQTIKQTPFVAVFWNRFGGHKSYLSLFIAGFIHFSKIISPITFPITTAINHAIKTVINPHLVLDLSMA